MRLPHLAPTILWFVPLALQAAIALVMVSRGLARVFPGFFAYTVLVPSRDVLLLLFPNSGNRSALFFWGGAAIAIFLCLVGLVSPLLHLFRPYPFPSPF